jgi:hypothetical protein
VEVRARKAALRPTLPGLLRGYKLDFIHSRTFKVYKKRHYTGN